MQRALDAAEKAIQVAPEESDGFEARGQLRTNHTWDWTGATTDLERGLALSPNSAGLRANYAHLLELLGKLDEAIAMQRLAVELDPLQARNWYFLGFLYENAGQFPLARAAMERALEISPDLVLGQCGLGFVSLQEGNLAVALDTFRKCPLETHRLSGEAMTLHSLGQRAQAQEALDRLIARYSEVASFQIATVYAWRGERSRSLDWLERAYALRDTRIGALKGNPILRRLHGEPRFKALLGKMNLPPD